MAVIFAEDASRCRADLGRRLEPAAGDALLKLCEPGPHAFHGFDALGALEGGPLLGVNDEHPRAWLLGGHLLHQCLRRFSLLTSGDAAAALDPRSGRSERERKLRQLSVFRISQELRSGRGRDQRGRLVPHLYDVFPARSRRACLEHDPEKLQTLPIRSCSRFKVMTARSGSIQTYRCSKERLDAPWAYLNAT